MFWPASICCSVQMVNRIRDGGRFSRLVLLSIDLMMIVAGVIAFYAGPTDIAVISSAEQCLRTAL